MTIDSQPTRSPLTSKLRAAFLNHPESIDESYFEHQRVAMGFAGSLAVTAAAAFVHGLVPCLCETTARTRIASLNEKLQGRTPDSCTDESRSGA